MAAARSFESNATALRETRIDNRRHIEHRRNSTNSSKYVRKPGGMGTMGVQHQPDSLDDVPDLCNNNQDVSASFE